jgi:uncharacterized protein YPO0396
MQDEKINKIAQMRKHIAACKESGLQVKQYCKEQKLKRSAYYYWCKKLQTDLLTDTGSFIELQPITTTSCVEIIFSNGVKINFESLVPIHYLKQLIG